MLTGRAAFASLIACLNGEVRAVGWQEQQDVRRVFKKSESWLCFVETGVVHDDNRRLIESREQVLFEPEIEPVSIG